MQTEPHVVIVGGGFSGAAVAIHLLRLAPTGVRVTLLEPREVPGAGVAYSTTEPSHRINVPAARMQLAGEEEGEFDRWYRSQPAFADDPQALLEDGAVYPQRGQFGRYVAQRFAEKARASGGRLTHLREQALRFEDGEIITDGGHRLRPICWCWPSAIRRPLCRRWRRRSRPIRRSSLTPGERACWTLSRRRRASRSWAPA